MIRILLSVLFVFVAATSVAAQPTTTKVAELCSATPEDARLHLYPLASGKLTTEQGAGLGLRPVPLTTPIEAFNHRREMNPRCGGTWVPEIILAGTLVWVDGNGYVAYKGDCGNRLVRKARPVVNKPTPPPPPAHQPRPRWFFRMLGDIMAWPFVTYE